VLLLKTHGTTFYRRSKLKVAPPNKRPFSIRACTMRLSSQTHTWTLTNATADRIWKFTKQKILLITRCSRFGIRFVPGTRTRRSSNLHELRTWSVVCWKNTNRGESCPNGTWLQTIRVRWLATMRFRSLPMHTPKASAIMMWIWPTKRCFAQRCTTPPELLSITRPYGNGWCQQRNCITKQWAIFPATKIYLPCRKRWK